MIDIEIIGKTVNYRRKLFYKKPQSLDALKLTEYYATPSLNEVWGYKRESMFTKIINLNIPKEELLAQCRKNTKYEVNRAENEGARFQIESDINIFADFYNSFAKLKNSPNVDLISDKNDIYYRLKKNLVITKAVFENEILVMHSYIADNELKRIRLFKTASLYRHENYNMKKSLIGRANRFLHYQDMIYFKNEGFESYDLGGYAFNTQDVELTKINEFKDSFGGKLVEESNYISLPLYIYRTYRNYIKRNL